MGEATIGGGVIHRIKVGKNLKKSYCQTPFGQNSLILCGITIRCGFKGCLKRDPRGSLGPKWGMQIFTEKIGKIFKKNFIKHSARKVENYEDAFSGSLALSLINHYSLGQGGATIFIEEYIEENHSKYLFSGGGLNVKNCARN